MKWFSFSGIVKEIKKIRWPGFKTLSENSVQVLIFTVGFGVVFFVCDFIVTLLLQVLNVIGG